jgi:SAM-dependent methyltransferase
MSFCTVPGTPAIADPFGNALYDYHTGCFIPPLLLHNPWGEPETLPVDGYFFSGSEISEMEQFALSLCRGSVLDIGAAAGRHALILQERGMEVHGLDSSEYCIEVMSQRGLRHTVCCDIADYRVDQPYDTLLLMMNGIGLAGNIAGLRRLLVRFCDLLRPGGQVLFDSSDIAYLYEGEEPPTERYYGEMDYRYEYRGIKGNRFGWIYVDQQVMNRLARSAGWRYQTIYEDGTGSYLARLVRD